MHRSVSSRRGTSAVVTVFAVLMSTGLLLAQSDRGTITGTVTDPSGAVVVGATVTATNTATGVATKTTTSSSGAFTIPYLGLGTYDVSADQSGFKKYVETGIVLQAGAVVRADMTLQLGSATETVNVTGQADVLQQDTSGRGNVITSKDILELPIVPQFEQRNPGFMMTLVPGVTGRGPTPAKGGPSGSSRQLTTTVNGSQSGANEFHVDGTVIGQQGNFSGGFDRLFFPPDIVGEFNVMTLNPPAEYGQSGLGITAFSIRSGSNQFHGSAWEYVRNCSSDPLDPKRSMTCFDARGFFANRPAINKQNEFGATLGGPIFKDKLFIFGWATGFRLTRENGNNQTDTLPTAAMKGGDLSPYLTGAQLGTDALGRPIMGGAVYDPATDRVVAAGAADVGYTGLVNTSGAPARLRDPFPGNIIPSTRIDPVAAAMFAQFADPPACPTCQAGFHNNWTTSFSSRSRANQYGGKLDYNLSDSHRLMGEAIWYRLHDISGSKWPGAISEGGTTLRDQDIARVAHDWIIRPNVVNHWVLGFDRSFSDNFPESGLDWPAKLGYSGVPQTGPGTTFPEASIGGLGNVYGRGSQSYSANNNFHLSEILTVTRGRHTVKTGFSYSQLQLNAFGIAQQSSKFEFTSGTTSLPGPFYTDSCGLGGACTGMGIGGFLLGLPSNGITKVIVAPTEDRASRYGAFVQDDVRMTNKLTINLGLRYDIFRPVVNKKNQYSWFDPMVVNPDIGLPGTLYFANPNRRNGAVTTFGNIGPRIGFAYSLNSKTVLRGGYGIMYTAGSAARSIGSNVNQDGFSASNTLNRDVSVTNPATGDPLLGYLSATTAGYHMTLDTGWPAQLFQAPPFISPSFDNGRGPMSFGAYPGGGNNPQIQNWSLNIQRQLAGDVILDVAYVGTKGTHLSSRLMNSNQVPTFYLTDPKYQFPIFDGQGNQTGVGNYITRNIADPTVQGLSIVQAMPISDDPNGNPIHVPFPGFQALWAGNATLGQALRPFPQYSTDSAQGDGAMEDNAEQVGVSTYHALQVQARKRFSTGLSFLASYTWSKTISDAEGQFSEFSGFTQDFYNRRGEKALSINDYPHNLVFSYQYELPFGVGKKFVNSGGVSDRILGGWIVAGVHQYQSGPPRLIMATGNPLWPYATYKSFLRRPNVVPGVERYSQAYLDGSWDPNGAGAAGTVFNQAAWTDLNTATDATAWDIGNAPRTDGSIRVFPYMNEDISIIKRTRITERVNVEFRADFLNIFNRTLFGFDYGGDQFGSLLGGGAMGGFAAGSFGHVTGQSNFPREIQFGLKINY